ncbi:MAG: SUMF1/EgtB/PvdO family nonheme iron enzyme [Polyangiaceae bacterium]
MGSSATHEVDARLTLVFALASLLAVGCDDPVARHEIPPPKASKAPPTQAGPAPMCRFEPVSEVDAATETASQLCYTPLVSIEPRSDAGADGSPEIDGPDGQELNPACPPEMVLVEGEYCPKVRHTCKRYLDTGFLSHHRCAEFDEHPECLSKEKQFMRFCIDRDEYVASTPPGEAPDELPLIDQSWMMARDICKDQGKRLCFETEWEFACEGEEMLPYPYGFKRDSKICNFDLTDLEYRGKLRDLRKRARDLPDCTSPFGVRNMVGNVDEWTHRDGRQHPWRASLRGGWWLAGRNNCRAATTGHDEYYHGPQTGFRCCSAAR